MYTYTEITVGIKKGTKETQNNSVAFLQWSILMLSFISLSYDVIYNAAT